ncbi:MAG: MarR family winged helix-turn-helix transcriptional regulator [Polyangiales bacterium]|nr:winged helix-turn-helix transcriptional regulator [Myxococcales bacterium]MCB9657182.1 winged helix-turn-helix transcriptional regulator [Sandaracinaceae bacterium]
MSAGNDDEPVHDPLRAAKQDLDPILETFVYLYTESRRATKDLAREHGLTGPQVTVLKLLDAVGDLSLSELSERIKARNSTITGIVDRMQRDELVLRRRSQRDRRVIEIVLTPKGRQMARAIPVQPMQMFASALRALPPEDVEALRRILRTMSDHVRAQTEDPST